MRIILMQDGENDGERTGTFITPDRSNRGEGSAGSLYESKIIELFTDRTNVIWLADGRPCVTEMVAVDGMTLWYAYFDVKGLESANTAQLGELLRNSGCHWVEVRPWVEDGPETRVALASCRALDVQQRPIWEFQVAYS